MPIKIVWGRSIGWNMSFNGMGKFNPRPGSIPMVITERIYDGADCYDWHEVFALWPVKTVSGKWIWWRKIYKRKFWVVWGISFHMEPHVEYGNIFDILAYDHDRNDSP
jgi:hypothetical protein